MHSEYCHTPSETRSTLGVLIYAEINRCSADPNRIRMGLFSRSLYLDTHIVDVIHVHLVTRLLPREDFGLAAIKANMTQAG